MDSKMWKSSSNTLTAWPGVFRIVVFGEHSGTKALFNGDVNAKFNLCLYHNRGHFDVIKSPAQFFDRRFYCIDCETPFSQKNTHTMHCRIKCLRCLRMGHGFPCQPKDGESVQCAVCRLTFNNYDCYNHHLKHVCTEYRYCDTCRLIYRPSKLAKRGGNRCGTNLCRTCNSYHKAHEQCFIPQLELNKKKKKKRKNKKGEEEEEEEKDHRLVAFDFESVIHEKITEVKERHSPNYASMQITCTKCIAKGHWDNFEKTTCYVCGPQKHFEFGAWELEEGKTVVDALLEVLLAKLPKGFITFAGISIIEVRIAKTRRFNALTIRDSVMLFPMKLAERPSTFDLRRNGKLIMAKTFFPYRYNRAENYGVRRESLPPPTDYIPEAMSKKEKKAFTE
ncbi:hypothetical protein AAVH_10309 [Aphelenchoides avenae]|nr:hypothetical protein AAVH_10309 [Aphelenchus avenae]